MKPENLEESIEEYFSDLQKEERAYEEELLKETTLYAVKQGLVNQEKSPFWNLPIGKNK